MKLLDGGYLCLQVMVIELFDMKSIYQWVISIAKCKNVQYMRTSSFSPILKHREYILPDLQTEEKQLLKEPNSVQMIDPHTAKLSDYSYPITKSSN